MKTELNASSDLANDLFHHEYRTTYANYYTAGTNCAVREGRGERMEKMGDDDAWERIVIYYVV